MTGAQPTSQKTLKLSFFVDFNNYDLNVSRVYNTPWTDLVSLFGEVVQQHYQKIDPALKVDADKVFVYAAPLFPRNGDDSERRRQKNYFSALKTHHPDKVEMIWGRYAEVIKRGRVILQRKGRRVQKLGKVVEILTFEEKETDPNIVADIVDYAHNLVKNGSEANHAVCLVSNDGDMARALVKLRELSVRSVFLPPRSEGSYTPIARALRKKVEPDDLIPFIRKTQVTECSLPDMVGKFSCPLEWRK